MGLNCRIGLDAFGKVEALNADGTVSQLYKNLVRLLGDESKALDLWSQTETESFKIYFGNKRNDAITAEDLVKFHDSINSIDKKLTGEERVEVETAMQSYGFNSLSQFNKTLMDIFKQDGSFDINYAKAVQSGLYSQEDLKNIDVIQVNSTLLNIEGELSKGEIFAEPLDSTFKYRNTQEPSNSLGIYPIISEDAILEEMKQIIPDYSNVNDIYKAASQLPYTKFVEAFYEDKTFEKAIIDKFKGLKAIPVLDIDSQGNISKLDDLTYVTIRNTQLADANGISIEANLDYLEEIDVDLWDQHNETIKEIVQKVEKKAAEVSIDIVGLSELSQNRDSILDTIWIVNRAIKYPEQNQKALAEQLKKVLPKSQYKVTEKVPVKYMKLNIVTVRSQLADNELFQGYGLIRVGDNLYHKVSLNTSVSDLYEALYNRVVSGYTKIPANFITTAYFKSPSNKKLFLKDLERFVNARDTGLKIENQEFVSLNQLEFDHDSLQKPDVNKIVKALANIKTSPEYITQQFITDFYQYQLQEKLKNSQIYREILSKFEITDQDITLTQRVNSIKGIEYQQALEDYIRLKGNTNMEYLVPTIQNTDFTRQEVLRVVNFPETVKDITELSARAIKDKGLLVLPRNTIENFLRADGKIYRNTLTDSKNKVYSPFNVKTKSGIYYNINTLASTDMKLTREILFKYSVKAVQQTPVNTAESIEKAGIDSEIIQELENKKIDSIVSMKALLNESSISIKNNVARIVPKRAGSKLERLDTQRSIIIRTYDKVQKKLKDKMGVYYKPSFVTKSADNLSMKFNITKEYVNNVISTLNLTPEEIKEMQKITDEIENNRDIYFEEQLFNEVKAGVDVQLLEDMGYEVSENFKDNLASIMDIKLELLSLSDIIEESTSYDKIGDCG